MKKYVLLGSTGQVGFELSRSLSPLGEVVAISRQTVDFSDLTKLSAIIEEINPDVIVNAAAYTMVDQAESDQEQAYLINAQLPMSLAKVANKYNALLVHYSTDYVYPGDGVQPWLESDQTAPLSVYGRSKLAGDDAIILHSKKYLIFRTSWVYAARGNNFMKTMINLAKSKESLNVVGDQVGSPTPARLIAQVSALAIQTMLNNSNGMDQLSGVYHLVPKGHTTWYDFANEIFALARQNNVEIMLKPENFHRINTEEYPTPATRPKNSRLNIEKIERAFGLAMPEWRDQLELTFREWLEYQR